MIPKLIRRYVFRWARYLHKRDVRRNRSAGSRRGWITRRANKSTSTPN